MSAFFGGDGQKCLPLTGAHGDGWEGGTWGVEVEGAHGGSRGEDTGKVAADSSQDGWSGQPHCLGPSISDEQPLGINQSSNYISFPLNRLSDCIDSSMHCPLRTGRRIASPSPLLCGSERL